MVSRFNGLVLIAFFQNDEIEKLALERSASYRKCRLEDVRLPLLRGNLKNVPMEEVKSLIRVIGDLLIP